MRPFVLVVFSGIFLSCCGASHAAGTIRIATFAVDASPPIGSPLAYDPTKEVTLPLSCRGIVLIGHQQPIVLCAVDWIGISNDSRKAFRASLAAAAGTTPQRVALHTLHQHDAPASDFSTDRLLAKYDLNKQKFNTDFERTVIRRAAAAVRKAMTTTKPVTHLGLGKGRIEKVASNRRILGPNGKVKYTRWTATRDPKIRAMPVGTIDPSVRMISFWNGNHPLAVLTYYATHPQSYYRTGGANPDFPGMARNQRQKATHVIHIHFNGAGGNIGAGKWNDGSHKNRQILADRVAAGMRKAWNATVKKPISADDLRWKTIAVALPLAAHLNEKKLLSRLQNSKASLSARFAAASDLVWLRRCRAGDTIDIACLSVGDARVLHMPGELFVEYQLAAQKMRPDLFVAMAAYGEYAPGYIGTKIAYEQGGYEVSPRASNVAPSVERVLTDAITRLLK